MNYRSTGWKLFFDSKGESRASPSTSSVGCCQQTIPLIEAVESIFPCSGRLVGNSYVGITSGLPVFQDE